MDVQHFVDFSVLFPFLQEDLDIHLQHTGRERQFEILQHRRVQDAELPDLLGFLVAAELEVDGCCVAGEVGGI